MITRNCSWVLTIFLLFASSAGGQGAAPALKPENSAAGPAAVRYEVVVAGGRVVDPASGLDAVRNIGASQGTIQAISEDRLDGAVVIDASGLIVSPGFIDLHS